MSAVFIEKNAAAHDHHGITEGLETHDFRHLKHFDEGHVLHELKHFLPSQSALKDFIHHNTLHAFQEMKFFDGIFKAAKIFGFQVHLQLAEFRKLYENGRIRADVFDRVLAEKKGKEDENWKKKLLFGQFDENRQPRIGRLRSLWSEKMGIDLDQKTQPILFRILSAYLDQGVSTWPFPLDGDGFLASMKKLEADGLASFFKTKTARKRLLAGPPSISDLLQKLVGDERYFEQYLFDQAFSHAGWSGFVAALEDNPMALLDKRKIDLRDLIVFDLLLEIDALDNHFGAEKWPPLTSKTAEPPVDLLADIEKTKLQEAVELWQTAFEWSYYDDVFAGIQLSNSESRLRNSELKPRSFQSIFCIDEREDSIRRHIESVDPEAETLGAPGFFGVEFFFQPEGGQFYEKLCPAPVTPKFLIKELPVGHARSHEFLYSKTANSFFGGLFYATAGGFLAAGRTFSTLFRPKMSPAISDAYAHINDRTTFTIENRSPDDRENGLQIGFTVEEMAARVEGQLRGTGLVENFAPLVYVVAHGSSSANNPHHGAHDCGACSGRPGSANSRVFAFCANHAGVRAILAEKGIKIPDSTQFVGGLHDTAADEIRFFDLKILTDDNQKRHQKNAAAFEKALDLNAKERSRRFASISTTQPIRAIRQAIKDRSVSLFEPRPELGHGTNTLCIVGRREMTRGVFLDRRAFLQSYNWKTDPEGKFLLGVMRPLGIVCGGINLEYYFSRVDNYRLGAGTKLPHNVVGLFGVQNSTDGDLRPGLPLQMIEVHDPVRLVIIVEHFPEIVLKTIESEPPLYEWFGNEWVHLAAFHPETGQIFYFRDGKFEVYEPLRKSLDRLDDFEKLVEKWPKMPTNETADATREHLPVYLLN